MKKRIRKKTIIIIGIVSFVLIALSVAITLFILNKDDNKKEPEKVEETKKLDEMTNYDYFLEEDATEYYKSLYKELKEVLNKEEINDEEYAKVISKLFVTDLFTLDNKITSSDIGGLQFMYDDFKEDFINIAKTTLYSSVESNIYKDRDQKLPIVSSVEVTSVENSTFNYNNEDYSSYNTSVNITYQEDLGYPTTYDLSLIKNDKYIQVVSGE